VRDATQQEVGQLKQLVADLSLEAYRLEKTAIPMPQDATGTDAGVDLSLESPDIHRNWRAMVERQVVLRGTKIMCEMAY